MDEPTEVSHLRIIDGGLCQDEQPNTVAETPQEPGTTDKITAATHFTADVAKIVKNIIHPGPYLIKDDEHAHYRRGLRDSHPGVERMQKRREQIERLGTWALGKVVDIMDHKIVKRGKHD